MKKLIASGLILTLLGMQTTSVLGYTKDETVYTKVKDSGESYQTIVNSHLINTEKEDELIDTSILNEIENVNGDEQFTQNENQIIWKTNKDDIYYQGKTDKQIPIDCEITYKLDGVESSAEEIAGKTGKVEIIVKYINKEEHEVEIGGEATKMYTPFVVMLGAVIDNSKAKNIEISSGKVIDNGKSSIVAGIATPGMQENLGISKEDIDIPDSITISLDASEFELGNMYSYVTPKIFENGDMENLEKLDELYSQVNTLKDSSNQIVEGANKINKGANTLNNKTNEFATAVKTYTDGVNKVGQNYKKIDNGIQTLDNGVITLNNGAGAINKGVSELSTGINTLNKGVVQGKSQAVQSLTTSKQTLLNGLEQLIQGKDTEVAGIGQVIKQGNNAMGTQIKTSVKQNLDTVNVAMEQVLQNENLQFTPAQKQAIKRVLDSMDANAISSGIDGAINIATNKEVETINNINNSKDGIKQNLKNMKMQSETQFNQGIASIGQGFDQITKGTTELQNSVDTKLSPGASQLYSGTESLKQGSSTLKSGSAQIKEGVDTLSSSGTQLSQASNKLSEGTSELLDGSNTLKQGTQDFDKQGIAKIEEVVNQKVKNIDERVEKMQELANDYNQFSGKEQDVKGNVKFIIMTDKVEKKEIIIDNKDTNIKTKEEE